MEGYYNGLQYSPVYSLCKLLVTMQCNAIHFCYYGFVVSIYFMSCISLRERERERERGGGEKRGERESE